MNYRTFATLTSVALLTAAAGSAQSTTVMRADIPFEFRVGTTILPPGHYEVRPEVSPGILAIQCFDCKAGVMIAARATEGRQRGDKGMLVFNRYGTQYFLTTVWNAGSRQGRMLRKTGAERELASAGANLAPVEISLAKR